MHALNPISASISLPPTDEARLQKFAPMFEIDFHQVNEKGYALSTHDGVNASEVSLPAAIAHRRLLVEISSRAAKWVHFHLGMSCRDSLLGQSDARLERIAALFVLDRAPSGPNTSGERPSA
jgi:hypothetical protein